MGVGGEVGVARPHQGGVEGGHGPAQVGDGLGVREVITGTATGTTTGGQNHLATQVLLGVPWPALNTLVIYHSYKSWWGILCFGVTLVGILEEIFCLLGVGSLYWR